MQDPPAPPKSSYRACQIPYSSAMLVFCLHSNKNLMLFLFESVLESVCQKTKTKEQNRTTIMVAIKFRLKLKPLCLEIIFNNAAIFIAHKSFLFSITLWS